MIGELIQTAYTYDEGRIAINNAFSGEVQFNGFSANTMFSATTNLYDIFATSSDLVFTSGTGTYSVVANNFSNNIATGNYTMVVGNANSGQSSYSFVGGQYVDNYGIYNFCWGKGTTAAIPATISGYNNVYLSTEKTPGTPILGYHSVLIGGQSNKVGFASESSGIFVGYQNTIEGPSSYSSAIGGMDNFLSSGANYSSIVGGQNNIISSGVSRSTILGGQNIIATDSDTTYTQKLRVGSSVGSLSSLTTLDVIVIGNTVTLGRSANSSNGANFVAFKSRGTVGSPSVPLYDDELGGLKVSGYYGAGSYGGWKTSDVPGIFLKAAETWSSTGTGTYMGFSINLTGVTGTTNVFKLREDTISEFYSDIKLNASGCTGKAEEGMLRYTGGTFQGYTSSGWLSFGTGSGTITAATLDHLTVSGTTDLGTVSADTIVNNSRQFLTLTDAATVFWDYSLGYNAVVTLADNRTLGITNVANGDYGTIKVIQDGTGGRTLALSGTNLVVNGGAGAITLTSNANAVDILSFVYDGTNFLWNVGYNYT